LLLALSVTGCSLPQQAVTATPPGQASQTTAQQAAAEQPAQVDPPRGVTSSPRPGYLIGARSVTRQPTVPPAGVVVLGDSIATGWSGYIAHVLPNALISGQVGRQFSSAPQVWETLRAANETASVSDVVIELGTNGYVTPAQASQFISLVGHRNVFLIVPAVPRVWEHEVQALYLQLPSEYPNVHLIRWDLLSANHPNYFGRDKVHPNWTGIQVMVTAIAQAIETYPPPRNHQR
jgi:hypothetical protein